jgi:hypothetical protein
MMRRFGMAALVLLVGCTAAERLPPPPTGVAAIGVAPVENKTGNKLVVSGDSYVAKFIGMEKRTVPDVLGEGAREGARRRASRRAAARRRSSRSYSGVSSPTSRSSPG